MKRHDKLIPLSRFHRSCLFLALMAKDNAPNIKNYPTEIPENIKVDISGVELNGSIHVSEITAPAGVTIVTDEALTICTVAMPKEEPEEPVEAASEGAEGEAAPAAEGGDAAPAAEEKKD